MLKIQTNPLQQTIVQAKFFRQQPESERLQLVLSNQSTIFIYDINRGSSQLLRQQIFGDIIELHCLPAYTPINRRSEKLFLHDLILLRTSNLLLTLTPELQFYCDPYALPNACLGMFIVSPTAVIITLVPTNFLLFTLEGSQIDLPIWNVTVVKTESVVVEVRGFRDGFIYQTKKIVQDECIYAWYSQTGTLVKEIQSKDTLSYILDDDILTQLKRNAVKVSTQNQTLFTISYDKICVKQFKLNDRMYLFVYDDGNFCIIDRNLTQKWSQFQEFDDIIDCDMCQQGSVLYLLIRSWRGIVLYQIDYSKEQLNIKIIGKKQLYSNIIQTSLLQNISQWVAYNVVGAHNSKYITKTHMSQIFKIQKTYQSNHKISLMKSTKYNVLIANRVLLVEYCGNLLSIYMGDDTYEVIDTGLRGICYLGHLYESDDMIMVVTGEGKIYHLDYINLKKPNITLVRTLKSTVVKAKQDRKTIWILYPNNILSTLMYTFNLISCDTAPQQPYSQQIGGSSIEVFRQQIETNKQLSYMFEAYESSEFTPQLSGEIASYEVYQQILIICCYDRSCRLFNQSSGLLSIHQSFQTDTVIDSITHIFESTYILAGRDGYLYKFIFGQNYTMLYNPPASLPPHLSLMSPGKLLISYDDGSQFILNSDSDNDSLKQIKLKQDYLFSHIDSTLFNAGDKLFCFIDYDINVVEILPEEYIFNQAILLKLSPVRIFVNRDSMKVVLQDSVEILSNFNQQVIAHIQIKGPIINAFDFPEHMVVVTQKNEVIVLNAALTQVMSETFEEPIHSCLIHQQMLYVGRGKCVIVYDLQEGKMIHEFITSSFDTTIIQMELGRQVNGCITVDVLNNERGISQFEFSLSRPPKGNCLWSSAISQNAFSCFKRLNESVYLLFTKDMSMIMAEVCQDATGSYFQITAREKFPDIIRTVLQVSEREFICFGFSGRIFRAILGEIIQIIEC